MSVKKLLPYFLLLLAFTFMAFFASDTRATHSWGGYHWARTSNPFTLQLGNNLASSWNPYLSVASGDWNVSSVLDTTIVPGSTTGRKCRATSGTVQVCDSTYGNNGWLGLAQIWISGLHITQGTTKMNDTYFNTATYNKPAWKQLVVCQEIAHTFGLDHQDVTFNNTNLGTCMDYTDDPDGTIKNQLSNTHPNTHDYEELDIIYSHLDSFSTVKSGALKLPFGLSVANEMQNTDFDNRSEWGQTIRDNGRVALFERDFGASKLVTFVIWAQE